MLACAARADFQRQGFTRCESGYLLLEVLDRGLALKLEDDVTHTEPLQFGVAARNDRGDGQRTVEITRGIEARVGHGERNRFHSETNRAEVVVPRDLARTGYVLLEERRKVAMRDGLGGFAHTLRIIEITAFLSVIAVHPLQDFTKRCLSMALVADREIEQKTQQFSFVVVGDAAFRTAVIIEAFEPRIYAGLFGRLCEVSRTALELGNLVTYFRQELLFVEDSGAKLDKVLRSAGHSFAEPKGTRVVLPAVIDWLQESGDECASHSKDGKIREN